MCHTTPYCLQQAIYHRFDSALDANNIETVECTNVDGKQDLTDAVEAKRWLHDDKPALPVYIKVVAASRHLHLPVCLLPEEYTIKSLKQAAAAAA